MTKFLLDSGDPIEYREIASLAKEKGSELWGATTNPSLIAKKLAGHKISLEESFKMQKDIVMEILTIVPGAVSAEVYADETTTAEQMIEQGRDIATWHERIVVKLPTNFESFKARTTLRKEGIAINNTLVFSQEQIYAICLHELLVHKEFNTTNKFWPPFISPFLGRLDDQGEDGISVLEHGLHVKNHYFNPDVIWMLSSSIRNNYHVKWTLQLNSDLMTAPASVYKGWFSLTDDQKDEIENPASNLKEIPQWEPPQALKDVDTVEKFLEVIENDTLNINHPLTTKGIERFTEDWKSIITT